MDSNIGYLTGTLAGVNGMKHTRPVRSQIGDLADPKGSPKRPKNSDSSPQQK